MAAEEKKERREQKQRERREKIDRFVDDVRRDVEDDADRYIEQSEVREGGE